MSVSGPRAILRDWAANAYAAVIGGVLCVLCAMYWGFSAVYLPAAGAYAIASLATRSLTGGRA